MRVMKTTGGKMMRGTLVLALSTGSLALWGCPPSAEVKAVQPTLSADSLPTAPDALIKTADEQLAVGGVGLKNAQVALERAVQKNPDWASSPAGYEGQWRLARAYAELGDGDESQRVSLLQAALATAKKATELQPGRVEGHYYLAWLLGYAALQQKDDQKTLLQQLLAEGEAAAKADEKFDHGGPLRLLGTLYARAPAPPVSVGDPEKAVQNLKRAVAADADFPPNHIYLADALIADERYQDAEAELATGRQQLQNPRWASQRATWKDLLSKVERKLKAKQT